MLLEGWHKDLFKPLGFSVLPLGVFDVSLHGIHHEDVGSFRTVAVHQHSFYELHCVLSGECITTMNNQVYRVSPGEYYLMPPGLQHSHRGDAYTAFALRFELNFRESHIGALEGDVYRIRFIYEHVPVKVIASGERLIGAMEYLRRSAMMKHSLFEQSMLFGVILSIVAEDYWRVYDALPARGEQRPPAVSEAIRFIFERGSGAPISVQDVAAHVHLSYSHLARLFAQYTGSSIHAHIAFARLSRAQHLLLRTARTVSDIAHEVGYNNVQHFSNAFHTQFGMTPMAYRKNGARYDE